MRYHGYGVVRRVARIETPWRHIPEKLGVPFHTQDRSAYEAQLNQLKDRLRGEGCTFRMTQGSDVGGGTQLMWWADLPPALSGMPIAREYLRPGGVWWGSVYWDNYSIILDILREYERAHPRVAAKSLRGYGRITIDEYTALVEGIMAMTFGPGEHSIRLPTAASFNTQKDAEDIAALFQGRADEMGWDVRSSNVREVSDGWIVEVFFWVSESGRTERGAVPYFIPQEKKQSNFVTGLGIVIGVGVLGALIYYGSTR